MIYSMHEDRFFQDCRDGKAVKRVCKTGEEK